MTGWTQEMRDAAADRMRARWQSAEFRQKVGARPLGAAGEPRARRVYGEPGRNLRRFTEHSPPGQPYALPADHPAVVEGTTYFRARRAVPGAGDRLLKAGQNNRKIGGKVTKGRLAGMPIFTLTIEERATCPRSCLHWLDCFGNKMQWPTRWAPGPELEAGLRAEIAGLSWLHPKGFLVRVHVLGDFYSLRYVALWLELLIAYPALHVYGYTAHPPGSLIGLAIDSIARHHWDRFAVRFSNSDLPERATTTRYETGIRGATPAGTVCPVESGDADSCGSCALCWQSRGNIVFLAH